MLLLRSVASLLAAAVLSVTALGGVLADDMAAQAGVAPALVAPLVLGDVAISGFSGTQLAQPTVPAGTDPIDETIIDPLGVSLRIVDLSTLGGPTVAQAVDAPTALSVPAAEIGQVFSLTFDDGGSVSAPNLYAAATSAYGLQIVGGPGPDGTPTRLRQGAPGAVFMAGQFGSVPGASPGTIYRIDGTTGAVTVFADTGFSGILNTGPGIGGLAFDPQSGDIYASDLDTGLIHRFRSDLPGSDLGEYDHGVTALTALGLPPVPDDGAFANIADPAFNPADPSTWGMTPPGRRVGALAVHDGRLFYSVADGPAVWSVSLAADGSFGADPRVEVAVTDGVAAPITGIVFDGLGNLIVAQRGDQQSPFDYGSFTASGAPVLRYAPAAPDSGALWSDTPDEYPVGLPDGSRVGAGGVALASGYNPDGTLGAACGATLLTTGDDLRDNAALAAQLPPGPVNLAGIQLNDASLVGAQNTPPALSAFVAFDANQSDPNVTGHVGSVAAVPCGSENGGQGGASQGGVTTPPVNQQAVPPSAPKGQGNGGITAPDNGGNANALPASDDQNPPLGNNPPANAPEGNNPPGNAPAADNAAPQPLTITKAATVDTCTEEGGGCSFAITIHNPNQTAAAGPVKFQDLMSAGGALLSQSTLTSNPEVPWSCIFAGGGSMTCSNPDGVPPGDTTVNLTFTPGQIGQATDVMNCTQLLDTNTPLVQLAPLPPMAQPAPAPTASTANGLLVDVGTTHDTCSLATDGGCTFVVAINQQNVPGDLPLSISHVFTLGADPTPVPVTIVEQPHLPDWMHCSLSPDATLFSCNGQAGLVAGKAITLTLTVRPKLPSNSPASALVDHVDVTSAGADGTASNNVALKDAPPPTGSDADVSKSFAPQQCATIPVHKPDAAGIPGADEPVTIVDGLKLLKTVDPSTPSCAPGKPCTFDITVTNTGTTPHTGEMTLNDIPVGSANNTFVPLSGASTPDISAPWTCTKDDDTFKCTDEETIAPGQSVTAKASLTLDAGFTGTSVENCALLDMVSGFSCASIPFDLPTPSAVNGVTISKKVTDGQQACQLDDTNCSFNVTITNTTDKDIPAPIVFHDVMTGADGKASADQMVSFTMGTGWSCLGRPAADCRFGGDPLPVDKLEAGKSATITLVFKPSAADGSFVKNCATLDGGTTPACATEIVEPAETPNTSTPPKQIDRSKPPMLRIDKSTQTSAASLIKANAGDTGSCTLAGPCTFGIAITNTGGQPFAGQLVLTDQLMPGADGVIPTAQSMTGSSPDHPKWSCDPSNGASALACRYTGVMVLGPGQSTVVLVNVTPGSTWAKSDNMKNCAAVSAFGATSPAMDPAGIDCATRILDPFNVKIQKTGDQSCPAGADCHFQLTLFNPGPIDHNAPVTISDKLNFGTAPIVSINPPLPCAVQPTQVPFTCTSPGPISLPLGGAPQIFDVVIQLPAGQRGYTNCATVGPDANAAANAADSTTSCVTTVVTPPNSNTGGTNGTAPQTTPDTVPPAPVPNGYSYKPVDLNFKKTGPAQCTIGDICTFTLLFTSERGFFGGIELTDSMDIGPAQIVSITPPMPCTTQPTQLPMTCDLSSSIIHVQPGQLLFYRVAVRIPERIRASSLTNCGVMDAQSSKDFNGNAYIDGAKSCATVALTPPKSPILKALEPPGGSPSGGINKVYPQDGTVTLKKTGDEQCAIDGLCNYNLTLSTDTGYTGPIQLSDKLDIGNASIVSIQPPLACGTAPTQLPLDCDTAGQPVVRVDPGKPLTYRMTIRVPNTTATQMTNCANVFTPSPLNVLGLFNTGPDSCVTTTLSPANSNPASQCFSNMVPDGKGGCGCPPGQTWDGQQCSSNTGGTNGTNPGATLQCPAGTVGIYPACRAQPPAKVQPKAAPACPAGTTGTYPNCKPTNVGGINKTAPSAAKKCAVGTHPSKSGRSCLPDPKPKPKSVPKAPPQQRPVPKAPPVQNQPGFNIGGFNGSSMPDINIGGFQMGNGGGFGGGFDGGGGGRRRHQHNNDNQAPQGGGGVVTAPPVNNAPPPGGGGVVGKPKPPVCPDGETFQNGRCDIVVR